MNPIIYEKLHQVTEKSGAKTVVRQVERLTMRFSILKRYQMDWQRKDIHFHSHMKYDRI